MFEIEPGTHWLWINFTEPRVTPNVVITNIYLFFLDGRKSAPINHGSTTPEALLDDAARVCKEYMERDPTEVRFTVVALAANE